MQVAMHSKLKQAKSPPSLSYFRCLSLFIIILNWFKRKTKKGTHQPSLNTFLVLFSGLPPLNDQKLLTTFSHDLFVEKYFIDLLTRVFVFGYLWEVQNYRKLFDKYLDLNNGTYCETMPHQNFISSWKTSPWRYTHTQNSQKISLLLHLYKRIRVPTWMTVIIIMNLSETKAYTTTTPFYDGICVYMLKLK